jgi:hypothetical protein
MRQYNKWLLGVRAASDAYRRGVLSAIDFRQYLGEMDYMPDSVTPPAISFHRCDYCGVPAVQGRVSCLQCGAPYHA